MFMVQKIANQESYQSTNVTLKYKNKVILAGLISALFISQTALATDTATSVNKTIENSNEILVNPDRGFQQFAWMHDTDKSSKNYVAASTFYVRFNLFQIEPEEGKFDFSIIDKSLAEAKKHNMKLAFRIMAMGYDQDYGSHSALPQWVLDKSNAKQYSNTRYPIPDYSNPEFLKSLDVLVKKLAERYDDPDNISSIDIGIVGSWGEWNLAGAKNNPSELTNNRHMFSNYEDLQRIPDTFLKYFKKVPLLMLAGNAGDPFLAQSTAKGTGWRADCFGDHGTYWSRWNHMDDAYPAILEQAENWNPNFNNTWKKAPVNLEMCHNMDNWLRYGYTTEQVKQSFDWALKHHASSVDFFSGGVPSKYRALVDEFSRKIGYRFELGTINYKTNLPLHTDSVAIKTTWQNVGSAPTYYNYKLAYRIVDSATNRVVTQSVTKHLTNAMLPASEYGDENPTYTFSDTIQFDRALVANHDYQLEVGFLNDKGQPKIKLPANLKYNDGWYVMGDIKVVTKDYHPSPKPEPQPKPIVKPEPKPVASGGLMDNIWHWFGW